MTTATRGALTVRVCHLRAKLHSQQSHEQPSSSNVARRGISQHVDVDQIPCRLPPKKWTGFLWREFLCNLFECLGMFLWKFSCVKIQIYSWTLGGWYWISLRLEFRLFVVNLESKKNLSTTFMSDGWTKSLVQTWCLEPKLVPNTCIWQHLCRVSKVKIAEVRRIPYIIHVQHHI